MKKQVFLILFFVLSVILVNAQIEQDSDANARGSFLSTRPLIEKKVETPAEKPPTKTSTATTKKSTKPTPVAKTKSNLGLGYTLYLKGEGSEATRVGSKRVFHAGEAIRLVVEPNTDGYLYVFHTENNGKPTMLFPDARLKRGDNAVQAHVPYEVPSSDNPDANLQWFVFDEKSATENVYLVLSRTPLENVPSNEELVRFCQENQGGCPWRPNEDLWKKVKSFPASSVQISKNDSEQGKAQSSTEKQSIKEVAALGKKASAPTVIYMIPSQADKIIAEVSLVHK